jgi:hypothetical protein
MHPYFNPLLLFRKYISHNVRFTKNDEINKQNYIHYLIDKIKITSIPAIQIYIIKHNLRIKFDCEQ